jgi:membrane protease YdiL (CAAX protease family)
MSRRAGRPAPRQAARPEPGAGASAAAPARPRYAPPGSGAKRLALWLGLVGLPLAYEESAHLAGPRAYFSGQPAYWFSGLQVDLALTAVAAALVAFVLWRDGEPLASVGWPRRLPAWQWALGAVTVALALLAALAYHPPTVAAEGITASAPVGALERVSLVGVAAAEALGQETFWRGAVIAWLKPVTGVGVAVAASVASFVFFHPPAGFSWTQLAIRLPLTLAYTALALGRRGVAPAAYLHFLVTAGQLLAPVPGR